MGETDSINAALLNSRTFLRLVEVHFDPGLKYAPFQ